jgi:hypothetical protein
VARGILCEFWYYPLYADLRRDSRKRYKRPHLPKTATGIAMAAAFLFACIAGSFGGYQMIFSCVAAAMLIPMANYINHANTKNRPAYRYNSKLSARHYMLILLGIPLFFIVMSSEIGLRPSESVVEGDDILNRDINYLQRKGIVRPSDEIVYFYSDAFLSIRSDGSGFSDRHVFSYWKDGNHFNFQSATFDEIRDIQVTWGEWNDNTAIEIIRQNDSRFVLYASTDGDKDKAFVEALRKRWKKTSQPSATPEKS